MSRYTSDELEQMTRLAAPAWHSRKDAKNIFPGGVPVAEVQRLFCFEPVAVPVQYVADHEVRTVEGKVAWIRSDNGDFLGFHTPNIPLLGYDHLLLKGTQEILQGTMKIQSAGMIFDGKVAWVSVSTDEVEFREGIRATPNLFSTTSMDSRIKNIWKLATTLAVCDNTWNLALGEDAPTYSFKRTTNGDVVPPDARQALGMIERQVDATDRALKELLDDAVPYDRFKRFLDARYPIPMKRDLGFTKAGKPREDTTYNNAVKRQQTMKKLWVSDPRVEPWAGTAFGVLQADDVFRRYFPYSSEVVTDPNSADYDVDALLSSIERQWSDFSGTGLDSETRKVQRILAAV